MHESTLSAVGASSRNRRIAASLLLGTAAAAVAVFSTPLGAAIAVGVLGLIAFAWWVWGGYDRWFIAFAAATCLAPPLPIALGTTGPHIALLAALLGLWIGLGRLSTWRIRNEAMPVALVAFWLVMALSLAPAVLDSGTFTAVIGLARLGLLGISVFAFFYFAYCPPDRGPQALLARIRFLFGLAVGGAGFACLDFYFQWPPLSGFGEQYVWLTGAVYRRAQGFFYDAGTLGNFCAFFLLFVVVALVRRDRRHLPGWAWLIGGGLILAAALVFSFSRSSLLNLGVALCALLLLERRRVPVAQWFGIAFAGVVGSLTLAWTLAPALAEAYLMRLWLTVTELADKPDLLLSGRVENWSLLLQFLADHPGKLLLGIGYATLPHTELLGRPVIGDNMYLTLLVETGLIGLSALIALQIALLATAYRVSRSVDREAAFVGTWIFCFWIGQLAQMLSVDVMTFWRVLPLYLGLLGMAVHKANLEAGQRHSQ